MVHWLCDSPSHYNDVLFRELARSLPIALRVHYRRPSLPTHPWSTAFGSGYSSRVRRTVFGVDWHVIAATFRREHALFVFGGWSDVTSVSAMTTCSAVGKRFVIWTDTPHIERKRQWPLAAFRDVFLRCAFRWAYAVLGTGEPGVKALVSMGVPEHKVGNFPYWIDVKAWASQSRQRQVGSSNPIRFVSSGRVDCAKKGHDVALRALATAYRRSGNGEFEYVVAGTGPDVEYVEGLARELGIGGKVRVLGWIEPDELVPLFLSCDVLLHPSPVHEPYGVAVLEGMAAELVVLASDKTCAALDRIVHGANGFLHRAGDASDLAAQIERIANDRKSMAAIGRAARTTAMTWPVQRGVEIFRTLLQAAK